MSDRHATIIYNPMSGRRRDRQESTARMVRLLGERGIRAEAQATTAPQDATRLARAAVEEGSKIIISHGGDGTLNEVLQGMVGSDAALAVWAGGTANVVARDLTLPFSPERLADVIAAGKTKRIALGLATSTGTVEKAQLPEPERPLTVPATLQVQATSHGTAVSPVICPPSDVASSRYFIMMAGVGLDASIARTVNMKLKRLTGEFAYWMAGISHLISWRAEPCLIEIDGKQFESVFTLIGNGKGYGGNMCMTPDAHLEDPWFDVYLLPRRAHNLVYLADLAACLRGNPLRTKVTIIRGRHVSVKSSGEVWVQADGELIGTLPMDFDVVPDALSIIVP